MKDQNKLYKTELHCHSKDASPCGTQSAEQLVEIYQKAGYDTVVLTNHYSHLVYCHYGCKNIDEYVDIFMRGFENMKKAAEGKLTVLLAMELRMKDTPNDYLCFGVDEDYLRNNPNIFDLTYQEFFSVCEQKGWLFVQAHPFRHGITVVNPAYLHGMEVYNGHIGHPARNFIAEQWANEYGLIKTSGTDMHYDYIPASGGILTEEKITDMKMLADVLRSGRYELLKSDEVR